MSYYEKYLKYKTKYDNLLKLKKKRKYRKQYGGEILNIGDEVTFKVDEIYFIGKIKSIEKGEYIVEYTENKKIKEIKIEKNKIKRLLKIGNYVKFYNNFNQYHENNKEIIGKIINVNNKNKSGGIVIFYTISSGTGIFKAYPDSIIETATKKRYDIYQTRMKVSLLSDEDISTKEHKLEIYNFITKKEKENYVEEIIYEFLEVLYINSTNINVISEVSVKNDGNIEYNFMKFYNEKNQNSLTEKIINENDKMKYMIEYSEKNDILTYSKNFILLILEELKMNNKTFEYILSYINPDIINRYYNGNNDNKNKNYYSESINKLKESTLYESDSFRASIYNFIHIDNSMKFFKEYIKYKENDVKNIINKMIRTLFQMIYCVYYVNKIMGILHLNCTLDNFCCVANQEETKIIIENKKYYINHGFTVKLINFENSKFIDEDKDDNDDDEETKEDPSLKEDSNKSNDTVDFNKSENEKKINYFETKNQTDILMTISGILEILKVYVKFKNNQIYDELFNALLSIIGNDYGLISAIIKRDKFRSNVFNNFDLEYLLEDGSIEFDNDKDNGTFYSENLGIEKILMRFIEKYNNILELKEIKEPS